MGEFVIWTKYNMGEFVMWDQFATWMNCNVGEFVIWTKYNVGELGYGRNTMWANWGVGEFQFAPTMHAKESIPCP